MGQTTIGWTATPIQEPNGRLTWLQGYTFNTHWGCFKVSPGCQHCYALDLSTRFGDSGIWGPPATTKRRTFGEKHWNEPYKWNRAAMKLGHPLRVFANSMSDLFEDHTQVEPEREKLWQVIEETGWLTWLLLTKRPEHIMRMIPLKWWGGLPSNVWIGTSVETQGYADERIPALLNVPATVRFLSCEPLLGPLDLTSWLPRLQWVITGGESGPKHRPMHLDWARSLRDQCVDYHVAHFFKQVGGVRHDSGGRMLDGRTWDEFPRI